MSPCPRPPEELLFRDDESGEFLRVCATVCATVFATVFAEGWSLASNDPDSDVMWMSLSKPAQEKEKRKHYSAGIPDSDLNCLGKPGQYSQISIFPIYR